MESNVGTTRKEEWPANYNNYGSKRAKQHGTTTPCGPYSLP